MRERSRTQRKKPDSDQLSAQPPIETPVPGHSGPARLGHVFERLQIQQRTPAPSVQPRLTISPPDDVYEQEADRVADAVMRKPEPGALVQREADEEAGDEDPALPAPELLRQDEPGRAIQRQADEDEPEEEGELIETEEADAETAQRSAAPATVPDVSPETEAQIAALRGGGRPLDPNTRAFMEPRFGHDFSGVRVHTDSTAARSARAVSALAYTVGSDVVFGAGQYQPETDSGRRLIAHELAHVVQQGGAVSRGQPRGANGGSDQAGGTVTVRDSDLSGRHVRRQPAPRTAPGAPAAPTTRGAARTLDWRQEHERLQAQIQSNTVDWDRFSVLLTRAIQGVAIPAPLQPMVPSRFHFMRPGAGTGETRMAHVRTRRVYQDPEHYWSWITFSPQIISETLAFTQSVIQHELQHCADLKRDHDAYIRSTRAPSEDGFVAYVASHSGSSQRHMEIYSQQAQPATFRRWSPAERLDWLDGALMELPHNVPAGTRLPVEQQVNRFYQAASPEQRKQIFGAFTVAVLDSDPGIAMTVLNHFEAVWADGDHAAKRARWRVSVARRPSGQGATMHRKESSTAEPATLPRGVSAARPGIGVSPETEATISGMQGGGRPLDPDVRAFMEPRFGHDFGGVRVHTDERAATSAAEVYALAYTVGRDVVFGSGQYQPQSDAGRRLIAHELAHVVQNAGARHSPSGALQRKMIVLPEIAVVGDPEFYARAERGNRRYAARSHRPGWPYVENLRRLWNDGAFDDFADRVREHQCSVMGVPENRADGILGARTAASLLGMQRGEDAPQEDSVAKQGAQSASGVENAITSPELLNRIARGYAYEAAIQPRDLEFLGVYGYQPAQPLAFVRGQIGFAMRAFVPIQGIKGNPILAFRGTDGFNPTDRESLVDWVGNLDWMGDVGGVQFSKNRETIKHVLDAVTAPGTKAILTGHSLGGSLAQITATTYPDQVAEVITFQSPGIDSSRVSRLRAYNKNHPNEAVKSTHYRVEGDMAPQIGDAFTEGVVHEYSMSGVKGMEDAHNRVIFDPLAEGNAGITGTKHYRSESRESSTWIENLRKAVGFIVNARWQQFLARLSYGDASDDDICNIVKSDPNMLSGIPVAMKVSMINILLDDWISPDDVEAIEKICESTLGASERNEIRRRIAPRLGEIVSPWQARRIRAAIQGGDSSYPESDVLLDGGLPPGGMPR